ncbi:MAG TPA: thioesterase family protein, partial [Polyangiaceae bacterium]|nr:thioesterase family protein [Polyangiaceae bacterium]
MSAFYVRKREGVFEATASTVGPWDPKLQHGSPVVSLLATRLEKDEMRVAHVSLDFLGPVPVAEMEVTTSVDRPGKKIELRSAIASVDGKPRARVSAWLLRTSDGKNPSAHVDDEPPPPMPDKAVDSYFEAVPRFGYGDALEWRFAEGHFAEIGPATVWSRLRVEIVEGEPIPPIARALAMVDSANGISAELDVGKYLFVPVNLSVSLTREPIGEWVGMRAVTA